MSRSGSIDWCCLPRLDSPSVFGRLLDWDRGGHCQIVPGRDHEVSRRYLDDTLILVTTFRTERGEVRLTDCFTMREGGRHQPYRQLLRMVDGVRGEMDLDVAVLPRFDYAHISPWMRTVEKQAFAAIGGAEGLLIHGDMPLEIRDRHDLMCSARVQEGERLRLSLTFVPPEDLERHDDAELPGPKELDRRMKESVAWWRDWVARTDHWPEPFADPLKRSAMVLKGLANPRTGAISAAATTSLPEVPGGDHNWDYRSSWIRDSTWAVRALASLGYEAEADGFRRFSERSAAGSTEDLQVVYGLGGEHRLAEIELDELAGWRGAQPVRIGNAAAGQQQLDVYGELIDLAWRWQRRGHSPDADYWRFLVDLVDEACRRWDGPDRGLWELREEPQQYVHSKAMCWSALHRGIELAEALELEAPVDHWAQTRDEIKRTVEERGYHRERGVFVRAYDSDEMDAALLLLPRVGFVDWNDERMLRTTQAIREDLEEDGLLHRFPQQPGAEEGAFLACSFWLVECLIRQGREDEARRVFDRACGTANDLGLFAEEVHPATGEMLGNFPQGLTHLSHISAALCLAGEGEDP